MPVRDAWAKWRTWASLTLLTSVLSACGLLYPTCTSQLVHGLDVMLKDSISGHPVVVDEIFATATKRGYADTVTHTGGSSRFRLVEDRAGVYTVEIAAAEYSVWRQAGVVVPMEDDCHVMTQPLPVLLQLPPVAAP